MAETFDRAVLERECSLPGLATALDAEQMTAIAASVYGPVRQVVVDYLRYKPGTSCQIGYRVVAEDGSDAFAFAKVCPPEESDRLLHVVESGRGPHPAWVDERLGLLFADASRDRALPIVARLIDAESRGELFERRRILPGERAEACLPLSYRPARRWVARLDRAGSAIAVLRAYADDRYERALEALKHLSDAGGPWPRLLSKSSRHRLVLTSWLPGRPLAESHVPSPETGVRLGRSIARFHAVAPSLETGHDANPSNALWSAVASASALRPDLHERSVAIANRLLEAWSPRGHTVLLHGDLSRDQVIDSGEELSLVDLDHVRAGEPEVDLGSLIASEWLRDDPETSRPFLESTLEAYRSEGGTFEEDLLRRATARALVHRWTEPFRRRHPDWPRRQERLVDLAERSLDG